MKKILMSLSLAALCSCSSTNDKSKALFDGNSLSGWTQRNGLGSYRAEGGSIVGKTADGSPNSFLCTDKEYGDFDLTFDVKVDKELNSGVQIRSKTKGGPKGRVNGPQVEIEATGPKNGGEAGYIYGESCGGWLTPGDKRGKHKHFKDDEWNSYRVLAQGPNIKVWINGHLVSDLTHEKNYSTYATGFIGLQVHSIGRGSGPYEVRWRNLRVTDLTVK